MHFCVLAARLYGRVSWPRKIGLNWFIPAFVNSSVGSSCGTTGELGTNVCPCFLTKKSMNCWRISLDVITASIVEARERNCNQREGCVAGETWPLLRRCAIISADQACISFDPMTLW